MHATLSPAQDTANLTHSPPLPQEVLIERSKPLTEYMRSAMAKIRCSQLGTCRAFCLTDTSWLYFLRPLSSNTNQWWEPASTKKVSASFSSGSDTEMLIAKRAPGRFRRLSLGAVHLSQPSHPSRQSHRAEACFKKVGQSSNWTCASSHFYAAERGVEGHPD